MRQTRQAQQHHFAENKLRPVASVCLWPVADPALQAHYNMEHENSNGVFHLFRQPAEAARMVQMQEAAQQCEYKHQGLDTAAMRTLEPAFSSETTLAGALYYPDDMAGNCVLFAKQMRNAATTGGELPFRRDRHGHPRRIRRTCALEVRSPQLASH
jgi:D-amino-acid dehydrogenase